MQLTLLTLLACIASSSAQDTDAGHHAHHQRAEHTTLVPSAAKAASTINVNSKTVAAAAKPTVSSKGDSKAKSVTTAVEAKTVPTSAPEGNDEALNATNGTDPDSAKIINVNALAKGSSGAGGKPRPTHKTNLPPASTSGKPYLTKAHLAIARMQTFYNTPRPGQWSEGWWNGANAYTLLADLRSRDDSNFIKKITDGSNGVFMRTVTTSHRNKYGGVAYDDWYDDHLWWVIGLIKAYDVTRNKMFLTVARGTFKRVQNEARGAVCGGLYNAMKGIKGRGQSTITTLLYVEATALFAKRYPAERNWFLGLAKKEWKWVMNNIYQYDYIRGDGQKKGPGGKCINNGAILSYIEGTAINALVALNDVTNDYSYLDVANTIANKSLNDKGLNRNGIHHENCDKWMKCNEDEAQFKGIFMRGLRNLYDVQPSAADGRIPQFLKQNADAIWKNTRSRTNLLGQNWDGPYNPTNNIRITFAQHSSGTMALVAAALL